MRSRLILRRAESPDQAHSIAGIAIYSFDLLWRTGKLFFNQVRTTFGSRSKEPVAWAEQLNEETIKISVRTRATWTAGAHAVRCSPRSWILLVMRFGTVSSPSTHLDRWPPLLYLINLPTAHSIRQ